MKNISFYDACKIAIKYYKKERNEEKLCDAKDIGEQWLFSCGNPNIPVYGSVSITVNKADGSIHEFILPDDRNFELLENAKEVEIPEEFIFKAS